MVMTRLGIALCFLLAGVDGSTYWASDAMDNHDGTSVTQSGSFATRYDTNALACGAFNARIERMGSQFAARSPAIDAGSDDAYGYDTTSTHPKVIDMGQPDIGYHYYRRVADDDPIGDDPSTPETEVAAQLIEFTFIQPELPDDTMVLERYIVPSDDPENPLHQITSSEWDIGDGYTQEGYEGKKAVKGILNKKLLEKKEHIVEVQTLTDQGKSPEGAATIRVIVDPDAPTVALQ